VELLQVEYDSSKEMVEERHYLAPVRDSYLEVELLEERWKVKTAKPYLRKKMAGFMQRFTGSQSPYIFHLTMYTQLPEEFCVNPRMIR
jgi:hypothetical protein